MYGNQSPRSSSGRTHASSAGDCEDLIAKYSKLSSDSVASSYKMHTVSLMDVANSFGEQGIKTVNFDRMASKYESEPDNFPDLAESLSSETAELIRKATSVKRDADASVRCHSLRRNLSSTSSVKSDYSRFVTPSKDDKVQRMLDDARKFQDYLEQSETLRSGQSHMTPPASNHTIVKDPPADAYDEVQRLLHNARKFESEMNRVALEPPECYSGPKVSPHLDGSKSRGYDAPTYEKKYSTHSGYNIGTKNLPRYSSPSKRFSSDYMKYHNENSSVSSASSFRSAKSASAKSSGINPILQSLNLRSKELKDLLEREKNLELIKTSSTWSDVRLNDIDTRLEYLKKRCSDLRQCTEMATSVSPLQKEVKFADVPSPNGHFSGSVVSPSRCDESVTTNSVKTDFKSLETVSNILDVKASQAVKPVALKVLSERVLSGYRITRETCVKCGVSKLAKRDSADHAECVFCPINDLRTQIRNGVARKILASKLLLGSSTISRGKLCELCVSPTLIQPDGTVICEVCPVLDMVCLEIAKEQSQGGKIMKGLACNECNASKVSTNNHIKCVACAVMKEWQQQQHQKMQEDKTKPVESTDQDAAQPAELTQQPSAMSEVKESGSNIEAIKSSKSHQSEGNNDASEQPAAQQNKPKIFESLMGQCGVLSTTAPVKDVPLNISNLQSQLLQELAKAKQCQIVLENSIEDPNLNKEAGSQAPSPKELEEELAKAKRCQYALERILETTSNMEQFPAVEDTPEIDDMMSAPDLKGSFSISQQEVEAGQPKEYIPPPSFFRSGIPSMVEVTLITPAPDSDLAQAYETNLKNTDNDKKLVSKSKVGIDFWPFTKADNGHKEQEQGGFDYDTIQTDDFTVDYTLNTMDDSRLEYLHIRSKKVNKVRFLQDEEEKEREAQEREAQAGGCSFINCFGCGGDDGYEGRQDDAYHRHEGEATQRENSSPSRFEPIEPTRSDAPSTSNEYSNTSTVSNGPAWIGGGANNSSAVQEPPAAANDCSEISDVSEHVIRSRSTRARGDRYEPNPGEASPGASKWSGYTGNSAVSDISGSGYRMQEANSVSSGNSGSFVKYYGKNTSVPNSRYGGRFSSKMEVLLEDESVDTSIDKYMLHPSTSGNTGNTAQVRRIIQEFERSNPTSPGMRW